MSAPERGKGPIGFFGGTFDPVHCGHLRLAETAIGELGLATVIWSPAGQPSHRAPPHAAAADRLRMVELATAGQPQFRVDADEARSSAPSYTVTALERLRQTLGPTIPVVLLLGSDAFAGLDRWHRWQDLFALAHLAITQRPGQELDAGALPAPVAAELTQRRAEPRALAAAGAGLIVRFPMPPLDISSTRIRAELAAGRDVRHLVPAPVLDYIQTHPLYRPTRSKPAA